ncbi:MAG: polysaccharide biosynthesis protein [Muribaculaceae bacterium]|nr:polysaccharide biosynthesis protein [Muribaculaceae bacterium]MDE5712682.1 polysaccharide biosynthesis protein [Muribaculaceae bacterium]
MKSLKSLANWYFSRSALPYWSILILDCVFVVFAGLLAYTVHHGSEQTLEVIGSLSITLCAFLGCFIIAFRLFHTYDGVMRYSSFTDLLRVSSAVVLSVVMCCALLWLFGSADWLVAFSYADVILLGLFVVAFMWTVRVWVKTIFEETSKRPDSSKAFVLGVKSGGVALAKNMRSSADSPYTLGGFVSADPDMKARRLMGVKVWDFDDSLIGVMHSAKAKALLVSPLMMNVLREREELVNTLVEAGIKIMVMPQAREWDGKSDIRVSDLHPIDVEDLLPREKIEVDMEAAARLLNGNVVMITGAAGSIGSEMVRQIATYGPSHLVLIDQAETPMHDIRLMMRNNWPEIKAETIVADIADKKMMERIFDTYRPMYVFHAAAYKHVPMMEDNPYEAVVNNIDGTRIIADLAVKYGTKKFVMVSTDKAVNPTNVMGCSKRICEIYVQSLDKAIKDGNVKGHTQFVTTRFGNVLGSNGSVIPIFQEQIRKGGPVTVTHPDIIRFFMLIPEACKLVIEAGTMGKGGEIYVFDMGKPVKIADLAKRMIKLSGAKDVEIKYTGLRDGEKLYEEVLNDEEITVPTFHPKIKIAKVREYGFDDVARAIGSLVGNASSGDDMEIVAGMKAIVPEFKSQHSKYEALDKPKTENGQRKTDNSKHPTQS